MRHDGNYIYKPLAITQHPQLSFAEQDYLCLIAQLCNRNGCTASNAWFARYFGVKPKRASWVICSLTAKKLIKTTEERKGKKVVKRTIEIIDESIKEALMARTSKYHGDTNKIGEKDTCNIEEKDTLKTAVKDTVKIEEDKLNIKNKDKYKDKTNESDCLFEQFWTAYPKKVSKAQAHKAFTKLNPDEVLLDTMLTALSRQRNSDQWIKNDGQYIPYPATWLGGRRWEDQLDESSSGCCMTREFTEEEADALYRQVGLIK
jgi:Mn-dependent DtxR family transcriptional regulator